MQTIQNPIKKFQNTKKMTTTMLAVAAGMFVLVAPETVLAGVPSDAEFGPTWNWLKERIQGNMGRAICGGIILVGIIGGIAKQSLMSFATGVGGGVGLYAAPGVVDGVIGATVPATAVIAENMPALMQISNGM
jgi:conjugal transfer pilus assembly protein TraA